MAYLKPHKVFLVLLFLVFNLSCQKPAPLPFQEKYEPVEKVFDADRAYQSVTFFDPLWRWVGNRGFNDTIYHVENILREAGYKKEVTGESDAPLTYRIEKRAMDEFAWDPLSASLTLGGDANPILEFSTNRNMLAVHSGSTSEAGVKAYVVDVGKGDKEDLIDKDLKGKIAYIQSGVYSRYDQLTQKGAVGILAYSLPKNSDWGKHPDSIIFRSIPFQNAETQKWAILLSFRANQEIRRRLARGPLQVTVKTKSRLYPSEELTLIANVRGKTKPDDRFVFSAHVQEPGANDNGTGIATLAEIAKAISTLIEKNQFVPQRTLTFIWGNEIHSTRRYVQENQKRATGIKWAVSLDMVGEDTTKTGGTFLIERMPDPSAFWGRGDLSHSTWFKKGKSALKEPDFFPHYLPDFFLNRCREQAQRNQWEVRANPYEGGSDHIPFLEAKIPAVLLWHFQDVYYHTDSDRLEMVSAKEMKNVGICALASALILTSADEASALFIINELTRSAIHRLETEHKLSREAVKNGGSVAQERKIIEAWTQWYIQALGSTLDINVNGLTQTIELRIREAQTTVKKESEKLLTLF